MTEAGRLRPSSIRWMDWGSGKNMIWICPKCEIETGALPDGELLEQIIAKLNYVIDHSAQATQSAKSAE